MNIGRSLFFKVSQEHDAHIMFIHIGNVSALINDGACFPDAACSVDDVVIADITPATFFHVKALNVLESGHSGAGVGEIDHFPALVMEGDTVDAFHGIDTVGVG